MSDDWNVLESRLHVPYLLIPNVFLPYELVELNQLFNDFEMVPGQTLEREGFLVVAERRKVLTAFWPRSDSSQWIYDRIDKVFFAAAKHWGLDVRETTEELKLCEYRVGDHFQQWHADSGPGYASRRKISISIELSDPNDYTGGEFEMFPGISVSSSNGRLAGSAVVFPSHRHHRANPVQSGVRRVLINWISGPPLR
ncbi:2OG-Fe(II) oxygenase [Xanthomonas arboricola]|uniref:2OG-Fe(II) oxygenase n=1 Tax=Xanthomonas arboricola TaxID=56448 RepID=UPI001E48A2B5|nr:2OG-Fe(II) oxygenase [Xanthomonas arboricola]MCC8472434.1 2OG-Fe(II) oxygenase [Xanthomonas arboricola]